MALTCFTFIIIFNIILLFFHRSFLSRWVTFSSLFSMLKKFRLYPEHHECYVLEALYSVSLPKSVNFLFHRQLTSQTKTISWVVVQFSAQLFYSYPDCFESATCMHNSRVSHRRLHRICSSPSQSPFLPRFPSHFPEFCNLLFSGQKDGDFP